MVRTLLAAVTLALLGLLWLPAVASASAPPYPAPPVTPDTVVPAAVDAGVDSAPAVANDAVTSLASTGAGFNVGMTALIAAAVLVVGIGLLIMGSRIRRSDAER